MVIHILKHANPMIVNVPMHPLNFPFCHQLGITSGRSSQRHTRRIDYSALNEGETPDTYILDICFKCKLSSVPEEDNMLNIIWYGCDLCTRWWHRHCLPSDAQATADLSCMDDSVKFRCPACPLTPVCGSCLQNIQRSHVSALCENCLCQYHVSCLPSDYKNEFQIYKSLGKKWYCGRCEIEK